MPKSNHVFYYCPGGEAERIEQSGKIYCVELEEDEDYYDAYGIYLSNISPFSNKLHDSLFDEFGEDLDEYIKLPKAWVEAQANGGKWNYTVLDGGNQLHRFLLDGKKQSLDLAEADYVIKGSRENPEDEYNINFTSQGSYFHYTTEENLDQIIESGYIKSNSKHKQFSGIHEKGVCITDANYDAHTNYIKRQCFRSGGNDNRLVAYIELPKASIREYAVMNGIEVLPYKDKRRSFVVTTGNQPLYLDNVHGWEYGYRDL
ncbi:uncharacterized protein LOC134846068 isoform X2 [Symsagittifera roscoffensis]